MTIDGVDMLLAVVGLLILAVVEHEWRLRRYRKQRRQERLRSRGLA